MYPMDKRALLCRLRTEHWEQRHLTVRRRKTHYCKTEKSESKSLDENQREHSGIEHSQKQDSVQWFKETTEQGVNSTHWVWQLRGLYGFGESTLHATAERKPDTNVLICLPCTSVIVKESEKKQLDIWSIPSQTELYNTLEQSKDGICVPRLLAFTSRLFLLPRSTQLYPPNFHQAPWQSSLHHSFSPSLKPSRPFISSCITFLQAAAWRVVPVHHLHFLTLPPLLPSSGTQKFRPGLVGVCSATERLASRVWSPDCKTPNVHWFSSREMSVIFSISAARSLV